MPKPSPDRSSPFARLVPWAVVPLVLLCLLAAPWLLGLDAYGSFFLRDDDFVYLAHARTLSSTLESLFKPHNAHVVPLFRLWVFFVASLAGTLKNIPFYFLMDSYGMFLVAILGVAHLVAWESRRLGWGFAALTGVGLSSVLLPTVAWYSAAQAVMAGAVILTMLQFLQLWRWDGRRIWIVFGTLNALAAPWIWSGGYVAGLAGFAYLWLDGRPQARRWAWIPLIASFAILGLSIALAGSAMFTSGGNNSSMQWFAGLSHTGQAIPEILVAANLGLDAATTAWQGAALTLAIALVWAWSRRWNLRPSPLEGAGLVMVLGGFGLAYAFRGSFPFSSLRGISWYQAIPELGAFLFMGGWAIQLAGLSETPGPPRRFSVGYALGLLGLVGLLLVIQSPRASRLFLDQVPPLAASELSTMPTPELQLIRGRYLAAERVERQSRFLSRLDRAETAAKGLGIGVKELRATMGRTLGPGMPLHVQDTDALNLLRLPASGATVDPARIKAAMQELLTPEPVVRPPWLKPGDLWEPKAW